MLTVRRDQTEPFRHPIDTHLQRQRLGRALEVGIRDEVLERLDDLL